MKYLCMILFLAFSAPASLAQVQTIQEYVIPPDSMKDDAVSRIPADSGTVFRLTFGSGHTADSFSIWKVMVREGTKAAADYTGKLETKTWVLTTDTTIRFSLILCRKEKDTTAAGVCRQLRQCELLVFRKRADVIKDTPAVVRIPQSLLEAPQDFLTIGYFRLLQDSVYCYEGAAKKKRKIERVDVRIQDGAVSRRGLRVLLDDGSVFWNQRGTISLPRFFRYGDKELVSNDIRLEKKHLLLGDVLTFDYKEQSMYPDDKDIVLDDKGRNDSIVGGTTLNQLLDVNVYSDLLGLLGNKANGIIQTEIAGNFISNTGNIRNTQILFHNFVKPYFRLSKLDSKFGELNYTQIDSVPGAKDKVNRLYLYQVAFLQAGIKTNIVRFGIGANQCIYLNAGLDYNLVNADSLYKMNIGVINYYPELEYRIKNLKNFGMECGGRLLCQFLTKTAPFSNKGLECYLQFYTTLYYNLRQDQSNRIYVRFLGFTSAASGDYSFTQFQAGYKTSLSLFKSR